MLANATVGASASVPPNEYNTLAAQLADKQNQLASREQEVSLREAEAQSRGGGNLAIYSLIASLVLALLVAMNFYFDLRRDRLRKGQSGIAQIIKLQRRG